MFEYVINLLDSKLKIIKSIKYFYFKVQIRLFSKLLNLSFSFWFNLLLVGQTLNWIKVKKNI